MKTKLIVNVVFFLQLNYLYSQTDSSSAYNNVSNLNEVIIVTEPIKISQQTISEKQLEDKIQAHDIPFLLDKTVGAVSNSDAGNGVGYSGLRIRGVDESRIQININGIPFNDAESSQAYFVNIPALANSAKYISIQRGATTSSLQNLGLGASVNISTNKVNSTPEVEWMNSYGSYNAHSESISAQSGIINDRYYGEIRLSQIQSNGYIDRASVDLKSYFIALHADFHKHKIWFNTFSGKERTYQAWNGVPSDSLRVGNRTYNEFTYQNQTDNYWQTHYQLHHNWFINSNATSNTSVFFTQGKGYYEEYKSDETLNQYGFPYSIIGADTFYNSNLIRQKWLDNDFYGLQNITNIKLNNTIETAIGFGLSEYKGKHFSDIIWMQYPLSTENKIRYENDTAVKREMNAQLRLAYNPLFKNRTKNTLFAEVQFRRFSYQFTGVDIDGNSLRQRVSKQFINPKIGFETSAQKFSYYAFLGLIHKEPNRDDFKNSTIISRPKAEKLFNIEVGMRKSFLNKGDWYSNVYGMYYVNQLALNGKINDVGEFSRINIPNSYRIGWENSLRYTIQKWSFNSNISLSINKSPKYEAYTDNWDTGIQEQKTYRNATLAFSPSIVLNNEIQYVLFKKNAFTQFEIVMNNKYVSKQNIDNYSTSDNILPAYFTTDIAIQIRTRFLRFKHVFFKAAMNNIFSEKYETKAWIYSFIYNNELQKYDGYFPQMPRNFMLSCVVKI